MSTVVEKETVLLVLTAEERRDVKQAARISIIVSVKTLEIIHNEGSSKRNTPLLSPSLILHPVADCDVMGHHGFRGDK